MQKGFVAFFRLLQWFFLGTEAGRWRALGIAAASFFLFECWRTSGFSEKDIAESPTPL